MFNKKIEYISKKNVTIFKIQNFLSEDLYNGIANEFPIIEKENLNNNFGKTSLTFEDIKIKNIQIILKIF